MSKEAKQIRQLADRVAKLEVDNEKLHKVCALLTKAQVDVAGRVKELEPAGSTEPPPPAKVFKKASKKTSRKN